MRIEMTEGQAKAIMSALDEQYMNQPGMVETNGSPPEQYYFWEEVTVWFAGELEKRGLDTDGLVSENRKDL